MENKLLYLGHASLRLITSEGKVIYIDPYMGNNYDMKADLVLVTHKHYDHFGLSKIKNKDYLLITNDEALVNGKYQSFDLEYIKIDAVEAGYNKYHSKSDCVGYVLTLNNNIKIYIAGDTYITPMMDKLNEWKIDYAFIPCDGTYTMTLDEAITASKKINAKYTIPYHTVSDGRPFDEEIAKSFNIATKLIIKPGEEIVLK